MAWLLTSIYGGFEGSAAMGGFVIGLPLGAIVLGLWLILRKDGQCAGKAFAGIALAAIVVLGSAAVIGIF